MANQMDDDAQQRFRDRPASERSGFIEVPLSKDGTDVFRIPLAPELGLVHGAITAALDEAFHGDPHGRRVFSEAVVRALPPGVGENMQGNWTVPVPGLQQVIENIRNVRQFGGSPVEPRSMDGLFPEQKRFETTNPTFDALAAGARRIPLLRNVSPLQAENLVRGFTASTTPMLTAFTDPLASRLTGRVATQRVAPGVATNTLSPRRAFLPGPASRTEFEADFYSIADRAAMANNALNKAISDGDTSDPTKALLQGHADVLDDTVQATIQATKDIISETRTTEQAVRELVQEGSWTPEQARQKLTQLRTQRQDVMRRAVTSLRAQGVRP
jgi:hypothetical protein